MILSLLQLLIVNSRCSSDVIRRNFSSQLFHDISKDHKHSLEINIFFSLDNWMIDELVIDSILNYHNNIKIKLLTNLIQMFIPVEYFTFCRYIYNVLISSCSNNNALHVDDRATSLKIFHQNLSKIYVQQPSFDPLMIILSRNIN